MSSREDEDVILARDGEPFATEQIAKMQRGRMANAEEYEVIPVGNGFGIQKKQPTLTINGTNFDAKAYKGERYFRVRFHPMSEKNQMRNVVLGHQGSYLHIQRNKVTIIPERFLRVAEDAVQISHETVPGQKRKVAVEIREFPFDLLGEATREEYLELLRAGNEATRAAHNLDATEFNSTVA